jgi:ribonuclease HI
VPDWTLAFDGLYEPRYSTRGVATYGFVVQHGDDVAHEQGGLVAEPGPLASANPDAADAASSPHWPNAAVAEFGALIEGLTWLRDHARERDAACAVRVIGDSRLVIETVAGRWALHSERLLPLHALAQRLAREVGVASYEKVPRERNARADRLSRDAYHALVAEHPEWGLRRGADGPRAQRL